MSEPMYAVWIKTGEQALGGTDSNVYILLTGASGQTEWIYLQAEDAFSFEEGSLDKFILEAPDVGALTRCCVGHDASADSGWYVESVRVQHLPSGHEWTFTFNSWVGEEEAGRRSVCADA
jgi:PLAT/LH2 domain